MSDFNVAPDTFSKSDFDCLMSPFVLSVAAIGAALGNEPEEHGWTQASCFDFEPCEHLLDAAVESLKGFAKANQLFYNTTKLEDATTLAFVTAFGNAFIQARQQAEGLPADA